MKRMFITMLVGATLLGAVLPSGALADAASPIASTIVASSNINGFRSAHFGMDQTAVRAAIASDFGLKDTAIKQAENPVQRTTVLSVTVPNLVGGTGNAVVSYVFGYKSRQLVEVNIVWATAIDPANTSTALLQAGTTLQSYFAGESFPSGQAVANKVLINGSVLLFRGTEADGHTVMLTVSGPFAKGKADQTAADQTSSGTDSAVTMKPDVLTLAYAQNPEHPDIFHFQQGSF